MGLKTKIMRTYLWGKHLWDNLWTLQRDQMSKGMSTLVRDTRLVVHTIRDYSQQKIGFQSSALSYQCAVALIPMVAIFFGITGGFGLSNQLKELLYAKIPAEPDIIDMIMLAAENIIDAAQTGLFGVISILTFVWAVIWLFMTVEEVFNNVWGAKKVGRNIFKRIGVDIVIMITLPMVIVIFFAGQVVYSHVLDLLIPDIGDITTHMKTFLNWVIFAGVVVMTLSSMYKFIPAAKVRYKYAFKSALIFGIVFTGLQFLYLETQVMVTKLNAFYGTVAAIPLFLIWLNYSWQIILYGAQLCCSFHEVDEIEARI